MEPKNTVTIHCKNNDCDSVNEEIYSLIVQLQNVVHTIMKFYQERNTKELETFCKKNSCMIHFILNMNDEKPNLEIKKRFEFVVRPYI